MTEVVLFLIIGAIAVFSAAMMLLSENAVHSALFLVVNFFSVAFLYLMLNAPFLAMIQVAVYAGAIMVLFLFVIMLLGAEKPIGQTQSKPANLRLSLGAVALALVFTLVMYVSITRGEIDLAGPSPQTTTLRFVNAATDAGDVDMAAEIQSVEAHLSFGEASDYFDITGVTSIPVVVKQAGTDTVLAQFDAQVPNNPERTTAAYTVVLHGAGNQPQLSVVADNLNSLESRTGRISLLNATAQTVTLVDFNSENDVVVANTPADDKVLASAIAPGAVVDLGVVSTGENINQWGLVDATNPPVQLERFSNADTYKVENGVSQLWIVTTEKLIEGGERLVAVPLSAKANASFGGPRAIGELLFTRYMLPMQLVAVLLLAAMVGAIVLTHKEGAPVRRRDVRRVVSKPLVEAINAQVGGDVTASAAAPQLPKTSAGD